MELRRLPATEAAATRYAAELWLPYHRALAAAASDHALADRPDDELIEAEAAFCLDLLAENDDRRTWVVAAEEEGAGTPADLDPESPAAADAEPLPADAALVAFVSTSVDACPTVFDRPDRLVIGDVYVSEPHRGTGLADRLVERAVVDARDHDCGELRLDVDVDNERALAFYERWGFEPYRRQLTRSADPG